MVKRVRKSVVPDVSHKVARQASAMVVEPVEAAVAGVCALGDETPERVAVRSAADASRHLLARPEWAAVVKSMVTFRRAYAVAYRELQELVADERAAGSGAARLLPDMLEDFLIQYAMYQASKPFSEHTLMRDVVEVFRWLATLVDRHNEADASEQVEAVQRADKERRSGAISIGFRHTQYQDVGDALGRERSLVLVGWRPAVRWLLTKACVTAATEDCMVVRFAGLEVAGPGDQSARTVTVGVRHWAGCADSNRTLALCMGERVADRLSKPPDLLVVDELHRAYSLGFVGRPAAAVAGDAHKRLRKWCDTAGAALVGALGLDALAAPDLTAPEYEQLRTFTLLRPVAVTVEADNYRLTVGAEASTFVVGRQELDGVAAVATQ